MSDMVRKLATEQRKRLVASVLNHCEQADWWRKLSAAEQRALREKTISSIGVYHDFILDLIKVSDDGVRNEDAITLITQVHQSQRRLEARVAAADG
jgi:hypothetical protein